ncbi:hypothetical protein AB0M79_21850 [Polymorphospora sp. NPDC051019]|uniref:hypothetical protein n=1 Tax=Polymorphospora sp. NPDC051019 TaxID=3155725 RepID=UPI00342870CC
MRRRFTGGLVLTAVLALALTGCGGGATDDTGQVATADRGGSGAPGGPPDSPAPTATVTDGDREIAFARCMRENGVDVPDPQPDGGPIRLSFGDGLEPGKVEAAMAKCETLLPDGGEIPDADPAELDRLRQFARCMRAEGIADFPDPAPDGSIRGGPGISLDEPKVRAAADKCQRHAPGILGGDR